MILSKLCNETNSTPKAIANPTELETCVIFFSSFKISHLDFHAKFYWVKYILFQ